MLSFGNYLLQNKDCWPDRLAVISGERALTYSQLNDESNRIANALRKMGLTKGSRLALLMESSVEWLLIWYACQKLGVAVVPLHVRLFADELARVIELAEVSGLVYSSCYSEQAQYIEQNCEGIHSIIRQGAASEEHALKHDISWDALLEETDCSEAQVELDGSEPCVILFTSGTTGTAKGVLRTHQMVCDHSEILVRGNEGSEHETILTPAPLYHTAGLVCIFKTAALGGTLVLIAGLKCEEICRMIEKCSVTQLLLVPPVSYQRLYRAGHFRDYDVSSVKLVLVTAGKCTDECISDIFEMFPESSLRPSWGSTETCSATGANLPRKLLEARPELKRTVGKLNEMVEVRLVDEQDKDVPVGTAGEALVRSSMVFHGYLGMAEKNADCFSDGWFRTEDIMKRDEDGYYFLLDRKRDIIKTGGENVYAQEIERVIQNHPAVFDCAVIGIADARFEEAIAVAVVQKDTICIDKAEFLDFCSQRLPSFKKPRYLAIMDSLPVNDVGKVQKHILRQNADKLFEKLS